MSSEEDIKSKIFLAQVYHSRLNPIKHTFSYNVFYFVFDLDELESGELDGPLFGYNKNRLISMWNTDYLGKENKTIKEKIIDRFKIHFKSNNDSNSSPDTSTTTATTTIDIEKISKIQLITNPRYLNHSFNPVNFYYCYDGDNNLLQIVAEINNTFGETHLYFPKATEFKDQYLQYTFDNTVQKTPYIKRYSNEKDFHVSPFNSLDGSYDFFFSDLRTHCFDIRVNLHSNLSSKSLEMRCSDVNNKGFYDYILLTRLWSTHKPLSVNYFNIFKVALAYPITAFLTIPRIMYQAGQLHWKKGLKIYSKPNPPIENTPVIIKESLNQLAARKFFFSYLDSFSVGSFVIHLPDGSVETIDRNSIKTKSANGNVNTVPTPENLYSMANYSKPIEIFVKNYDFFWKLYVLNKSNGRGFSSKALGLAYMSGDFECNDLPSLLAELCDLTISFSPSLYNSDDNSKSSIFPKDSKYWGDIFKFIENDQNLFSPFLFDKSKSILNPYICNSNNNNDNDNSNNTYQIIIDKLSINDGDIILQIEPTFGCQFSKYLLDLHPNCKIVLLSSLIDIYNHQQQQNNNSNVIILNNNLSQLIQDSKYQNYFNHIISLEGNIENSFYSTESNNRTRLLLDYCKTLFKNNKGLLFIQSISGPYHQYQEIDLKPNRKMTFWNKYSKLVEQVGKKYWAVIANFQHNPFYVEERYKVIMNVLSKGYINGHIFDESSKYIPNIPSDLTNICSDKSNDSFNLLEMQNIGDDYPEILQGWIDKLQENRDSLNIQIQEIAMQKGCHLKMNQDEIDEIYRAILFHLSFLISCFKSVWSVTRMIIEIK
ncbi:hypothetical protein CYY_006332 [Polysphondylium violaceum]|uniref:Uncharacterized protein n=1 Tax=Polysphondylium violaceum TaxID=133409 RepID=A0A8J4V393_9MYCE|nr:hypothetical protein CYY_006332 [Polysphondylium violaceum]